MKPLHLLSAAALASLSMLGAAQAQTTLKPGLWEQVSTIRSDSGQIEKAMAEAQAQIAKLPPEQRQQIEKMMAERGVGIGGTTTTLRLCLSAADLERGNIPVQAGECTQKLVSRDGSTMKVAFQCDTDPPSSGTGEIRIVSPTANEMTATVETTVNGRPDRLHTTQKGTWLGEDCGHIRPKAGCTGVRRSAGWRRTVSARAQVARAYGAARARVRRRGTARCDR